MADFFLTFDNFDYSKSQVVEETGISRITVDKIWGELSSKKIKTVRKSEFYWN